MAVIALDTLANALCLAMMLRITGGHLRSRRIAVAALLGALGAKTLRLAGLARGETALLWLPLALGMCAAAGAGWSLRAALCLLASAGLLGGAVYALAGALGSLGAAWCAGAIFALAMLRSAMRARRVAMDMRTVTIRIIYGGHAAELRALVDSGNCLRDYLTHRPVIVLPESAREALGLAGVPLRPILAETAGGRQMMDCFTPQNVWIMADRRRTAVKACVAFSPGLSLDAPALLPQSLLTADTKWDEPRADQEGNAYGKAEG